MRNWFSLFLILILIFASCDKNSQKSVDKILQEANESFYVEDYLVASNYYTECINKELTLKNVRSKILAECEIGIGKSMFYLDSIDVAVKHLLSSINYSQEAHDSLTEMFARIYLSMALNAKNEFDKSLIEINQALRIQKSNKNIQGKIAALLSYSDWYSKNGKIDSAYFTLNEVLKISKLQDDKPNIALCEKEIGSFLHSKNLFDSALVHYEKAIAFYKAEKKINSLASIYFSIGSIYNNLNKYEQAKENFQIAENLINRIDNNSLKINILIGLGTNYFLCSNYTMAIDEFNNALKLTENAKFQEEKIAILNNLGKTYSDLDQFFKALYYYKQSLALANKLNKTAGISNKLSNIGTAYYKLGSSELALQYLNKALEIDKKSGNPKNIATRILNISRIKADMGKYNDAIADAHVANQIFRNMNMQNEVALTEGNIGSYNKKLGNYKAAIQNINDALAIKENQRQQIEGYERMSFLNQYWFLYHYLIDIYSKMNDYDNVFKTIELSRSKFLSEMLDNPQHNYRIITLQEFKQMHNDNEASVIYTLRNDNYITAFLVKNNFVKISEFDVFTFINNCFRTLTTDYGQYLYLNLPNENTKYIRTLKRSNDKMENYAASMIFRKTILYYLDLMQNLDPNNSQKNNFKIISGLLYDLLFKEIANDLENITELRFMPDNALNLISMEALIDKNGNYLINNYCISYIQSASILNMLNQREYSPERKPIIAFGGAEYNNKVSSINNEPDKKLFASLYRKVNTADLTRGSLLDEYNQLGFRNFENLPGSLEEVNKIALISPEFKVYTGKEVSEPFIKHLSDENSLQEYKIIHFSTHGVNIPELPQMSALVLSHSDKDIDDGFLRTSEIMKMKINADLVNLSSCQSGMGKVMSGEGIFGISQAFIIAGANGTSVSLWSISDEATAEFMIRFYTLIYNEKISYQEAFSRVKREFINGEVNKSWTQPFYWAPFVYYGE